MRATFDPYAGAAQLLFAFEAAVIGGAGSLWGTLVGGIVLGVAQSARRAGRSAGLPDRAAMWCSSWCCSRASSLAARASRLRAALGAGMSAAMNRRRPLDHDLSHRDGVGRAHRRRAGCSVRILFGADAVDRLTTLFIYVILAAMWNALAGYGGLVSVGQQAFFGLGAYCAIRLANSGVSVYPSCCSAR